ncbi:MAG: preprotein translocase subunit SecG [Candidatus Poribacteria bacterium]|nr:preprotein translocase subunit SecG [Candidatus Poribacteria bacterium]
MGIFIGFVMVLFVPVCILLVVIILLQDSKGEGLSSSAFGASEVQSILGGRGAATFLSKLTTWLAVGFMVMSLFLMRFYGDINSGALTPIETEEAQSESAMSTDDDEANQTETDEVMDAVETGGTGDAESDSQ